MMTRLLYGAAIGVLISTAAGAQSTQQSPPPLPSPPPALTQPGQPAAGQPPAAQAASPRPAPDSQPAAAQLGAADRKFIADASAAGMAEVEAGRLAAAKANDPRVKEFGQHMVDDHGKANDELAALAKGLGANAAPPTAAQQRSHDRLDRAMGANFDRRYINEQVREHRKAVQLFEQQANNGQNASLQQFAAGKLPTLRQHLAMAESIAQDLHGPQAKMNGVAPASGGQHRSARSAGDQGPTADQLNEAEYRRVRGGAGAQASAQPGQLRPGAAPGMSTQGAMLCGPQSAQVSSRDLVQPGTHADSTKPGDTNVAERRAQMMSGC